MPNYSTLDEALHDIANRSFYEDATVFQNSDGSYTVENDYGMSYAGDDIKWTYEGGMEIPDGVIDNTRLMETYETLSESSHIRFWLDAALERLESGNAVTFAYAVVSAYPGYGAYEGEDYAVGWVLMAYAV